MNPLLQSNGTKPRKGAVLTCPQCNTEFYVVPAEAKRRKYCSRACKQQAAHQRTTKTCPSCGQEFEKATSRSATYCSWACYYDSRKPRKLCLNCEAPLSKSARIFCSKACEHDARRMGEYKRCEVCDNEFYVQPYLHNARRFCSVECKNDSMRIKGPGSKYTRKDGYVMVYFPSHPNARAQGFILEHRLVMEQKLGRRLTRGEQVHHINHVRNDNRPENLALVNPSDHARESNAFGVRKRQTMREKLAEYEKRFGPLD